MLGRPLDLGKAALQRIDDVAGILDRQCRLGQIGELVCVAGRQSVGLGDSLDEGDCTLWQLPHRAHDFGVTPMSDQDDSEPLGVAPLCLYMHFADERAGGIDLEEMALARRFGNRLGHPVGREHDRPVVFRDFVELVDEDRCLALQLVDHEFVVNDLVAHIDRPAIPFERSLDDFDGAHHPSTKSTRRGHQDRERRLRHGS